MPLGLQKKPELHLTALGGVERVGTANCYLLESPDAKIMIDCGFALNAIAAEDIADPAAGDAWYPEQRVPSVEASYPDFKAYIEILKNLDWLLVSHGHLDHCGAIAELYKALRGYKLGLPTVVSGELTKRIIDGLFYDEYLGLESLFSHRQVIPDQPLGFYGCSVVAIEVPHSIPKSYGFYTEIAGQKIFYSGDFKVNDVSEAGTEKFKYRIKELSERNIDFLFIDSTNIYEDGYTPSEREAWPELASIIEETPGRIIFSTFSSHIQRLSEIIRIAHSKGRPVYACGRRLLFCLRSANVQGWARLDEYTRPESNAVILATGCQAEPNSVLDKYLQGEAPFGSRDDDSFAIATDPIPTPEVVSRGKRMVEVLLTPGPLPITDDYSGPIRKVYISKDAPSDFPRQAIRREIHESGHGKKGDLRYMISAFEPNVVIPIHGDLERREAVAELAKEEGCESIILEQGVTVTLS